MTNKTIRRLERLRNYATLYELIAEHGERRILIAYCQSRSRATVLRVCHKHGPALAELTGKEAITWAKRSSDGATMGEWRIHFSGRTNREAISTETELPWIGDQVAS